MNKGKPAYVSQEAQAQAWAERSADGFPVGATEWEDNGNESHAWVGGLPQGGAQPQSRAPNQAGPSCMYSAQGNIVCQQ